MIEGSCAETEANLHTGCDRNQYTIQILKILYQFFCRYLRNIKKIILMYDTHYLIHLIFDRHIQYTLLFEYSEYNIKSVVSIRILEVKTLFDGDNSGGTCFGFCDWNFQYACIVPTYQRGEGQQVPGSDTMNEHCIPTIWYSHKSIEIHGTLSAQPSANLAVILSASAFAGRRRLLNNLTERVRMMLKKIKKFRANPPWDGTLVTLSSVIDTSIVSSRLSFCRQWYRAVFNCELNFRLFHTRKIGVDHVTIFRL